MNRTVSPMRHDYKPNVTSAAKKKSPLPWFAAGLGIPVVGMSLFLMQASGSDATTAEPLLHASPEAPIAAPAYDSENIVATAETPAPAEAQAQAEPAIEPVDKAVAELVAELDAEPTNVAAIAAPSIFQSPLKLAPEYERIKLTVKRGDTLDRLFRRNNLDIGHLAMMLNLPDAAPYLKKVMPGDELIIEHDGGDLMSLYRELSVTSALKIEKEETGYAATMIERPLDIRRKKASGNIENSLYLSAIDSGISDKTIMNLAGIFAWDVDFVLDIRRGDSFRILYEEMYQNGEYIGDGEIIAAEFNNRGRTIQAIRYVDKNGRADYFTPEGQSVRKAFLRAPVDFRVSSSFNPNRRHPVLKTVRPHRGTDYAAPSGTPIKAAGDGKVIFRGVKSGYGNVVILQHGGNITTLYAHMSRFNSKVRNGTRVRQGQTIGYVGKTGLVTGVHLHYEYRVNGVHRNSRTVKLPQADPINAEYRSDFLASVGPLLDELSQTDPEQVAELNAD